MPGFAAGGQRKPRSRPPTSAMSLLLLLCLASSWGPARGGTLPQPDHWVSMATYEDLLSSMAQYREERTSSAADGASALPVIKNAPVLAYHDPQHKGANASASVVVSDDEEVSVVSDSQHILHRLRRSCALSDYMACAEGKVIEYVDRTLSRDSYQLTSAISLEPVPTGARSSRTLHQAKATAQAVAGPGESSQSSQKNSASNVARVEWDAREVRDSKKVDGSRGARSLQQVDKVPVEEVADHILDRMQRFAQDHVVRVKLPELARELGDGERPKLFGKNSFLTGFGLGFLAFGLKKLLLPFFIGAQIVKSVLIAMFLPSILGSIGKLVGKGVTTFATTSAQSGGFSGHSGSLSGGGGGGGGGGDGMEDFDFKDNGAAGQYPDAASSGSEFIPSYATLAAPPGGFGSLQTLGTMGRPAASDSQPLGTLPAMFQAAATAASNVLANKFQTKTSYAHRHTTSNSLLDQGGSFYNRHKPHDFKTFHNIPSSSMLLTHYDPFYSPLLSRLDTVFHQLGYTTESCRERLVCAMYRNPAKFAPFSNLVSAQLSRELNELRKPSSDNPEILRFFRYMKAAKDGQDNRDCNLVYAACTLSDASQASPMTYTFQDINKLVQARRLAKNLNLNQTGVESTGEVAAGPPQSPQLNSTTAEAEAAAVDAAAAEAAATEAAKAAAASAA